MFQPPFCPYRDCPSARSSKASIRPHGSYHPKCRPRPVPRFRCKSCNRTFSRQTFRMDYCDNRPHLNPLLVKLIASGVGIRQASRMLGLSRRCTELKLRKIGRHLRRLNINLTAQLPPDSSFQFDEFESFEGQRTTRPVSVPMLIESGSRYIIWSESAPIRPHGKITERRRKRIEASEKRHGVRKDLSVRSIRRTLERGASIAKELTAIVLRTDEKPSYRSLAAKAFGAARLWHWRTNSQEPRTTFNPLFGINHEEAMARDLMGRLRRRSWLASKQRRFLDIALHVHIAFRNLVRRRFNYDEESPAAVLGFLPRRLRLHEILNWRQEFGKRSIHPLARRSEAIEDFAF